MSLPAVVPPGPAACCWRCDPNYDYMLLCALCGNKRCPRASDHDLECTGSNEPGQPGSIYGGYPAPDRTPDAPPDAGARSPSGHAIPEHVAELPVCKVTGKVSWPTTNAAWSEIKRLGWNHMTAFACRDCDGAHMGTPKGQHRRRGRSAGRRRHR